MLTDLGSESGPPVDNSSATQTDPTHGESDEAAPESTDTSTDTRPIRLLPTLLENLLLLLAPAVVYLAYGIRPFFEMSGADPFIYIGYTMNPADLIERYGYSYYAVRFGLIIPSNILTELFGPIHGYLALRWIVSAIAAVCVYHLLKRMYRWEAGVVGVVMLLMSPTYLTAVMTAYATTIGVPLIAAAFALILMPTRTEVAKYRYLGAGLLFGLAMNANIFVALPIVTIVATWVGFTARSRGRRTVVDVVWIGLGSTLVFLAGAAVYWLKFGDPNLISPSLNAAEDIQSWSYPGKEPNLRWLNFQPETWLAPFASLIAFVALRTARRVVTTTERIIAFTPVILWVVYALLQFVFDQYMLETYFYLSYLIGPALIAMAMTIQLVAERRNERLLWLCAPLVALGLPILWTNFGRGLAIWTLNGVIPLTAAGTAAVWFAARSRATAFAAICIVGATPFLLSVGTPRGVPLADGQEYRMNPSYEHIFFQYDSDSLELYQIAADFTASLPRSAADPGSLVFWVDPVDTLPVLTQWTHLGWYSNVQPFGEFGRPFLDQSSIDRVLRRTPRYLIAMSSNPDVIRNAQASLEASGLPIVGSSIRSYERGPYRFETLIVELEPAPCDSTPSGQTVPWSSLDPCPAT